jgi:hypothetical protein
MNMTGNLDAGTQKKIGSKANLFCGAADRDRTGTTVARREILSLLRLPIPPQRHESSSHE